MKETKGGVLLPDENEIHLKAGNILNKILLAHKQKWHGDNEIQDMLAEAFVKGVEFERDNYKSLYRGGEE